MAQNQNNALNPIRMDSRKFLGALNDSAQAKIAFFESKVSEMGKAANKNWRLAALYSKDLYIEDLDSNSFYMAKHQKNQGAVTITDIRPINIVENEKAGLFEESCLKLVEAIEKNDQKGMQHAFGRMKAQRFTGRIIPESGMVKGKDGILRKVEVKTPKQIDEEIKTRLVKAVVESISNRVIVEDSQIVGGNFIDGDRVNLPVSKWGVKKLNAKTMLNMASSAYLSEGFQNRIYDLAGMISEGKIEEAVKTVAPFLDEFEEFTLLNRDQVRDLVANSLAAKAVFNPQLCEDVSTLFFKTNLKVNRTKILKEWKNIAGATENFNLAQNISVLEESSDFENTYNKFLELIFETIGNREIAAEALATTLSKLKEKTPQIKESNDLSAKLDDLIGRLKGRSVDDATIYEAEDLIATIQEELDTNDSLANFDTVPGEPSSDAEPMAGDAMSDAGAPKADGPAVININAPLVMVGGNSNTGAKEAESLGGVGEEPVAPEAAEDDLAALLNEPPTTPPAGAPAAEQAPAMPAAPAAPAPGAAPAVPALGGVQPRSESRNKAEKPINESRPKHAEMLKHEVKGDDDEGGYDYEKGSGELKESTDIYGYQSKTKNSSLMGFYGKNIIEDKEKVDSVIKMAQRYILSKGLDEAAVAKNIYRIIESIIKNNSDIIVNKDVLPLAINQLVEEFTKRELSMSEDQQKSATKRRRMGLQKTGYAVAKGKGKKNGEVKEEGSLKWLGRNGDVLIGEYNGLKFALDHGNKQLPPVLMSEDGTVEIPIPKKVQPSALAAASLTKGNSSLFKEWLSGSIGQLSPISEDEKAEISAEMDEELEKMSPVESTEPAIEVTETEEAMPDFSEMDKTSDESSADVIDDEVGVDLGDVDMEGDSDDLSIDLDAEDNKVSSEISDDASLEDEIAQLKDDIEEIKDHVGIDDSEDLEEMEMDIDAGKLEDDIEEIEDMGGEMDDEEITDISNGEDDIEDDSEDEIEDVDEDEEADIEVEEDEEFEGLNEDNDITDPDKSKYHKQAEEDPRTDVDVKLHKRKDDESVEGIGDREDIDELDI